LLSTSRITSWLGRLAKELKGSTLHRRCHVADVLMDRGYVVGQMSKNRAEQRGESCFVVLHNDSGAGHAVVVLKDNRIFDPERRFNEGDGNFYQQCMGLGWKVDHVLVFRKL